jgi:hypothetical protein
MWLIITTKFIFWWTNKWNFNIYFTLIIKSCFDIIWFFDLKLIYENKTHFFVEEKTCSTATMNLLCSCKSIAKNGCKVVFIGSWVKIVPLGSIIFYWIKEMLKKISKQINLTVIFEALIYIDSLGEWSITRFRSSK